MDDELIKAICTALQTYTANLEKTIQSSPPNVAGIYSRMKDGMEVVMINDLRSELLAEPFARFVLASAFVSATYRVISATKHHEEHVQSAKQIAETMNFDPDGMMEAHNWAEAIWLESLVNEREWVEQQKAKNQGLAVGLDSMSTGAENAEEFERGLRMMDVVQLRFLEMMMKGRRNMHIAACVLCIVASLVSLIWTWWILPIGAGALWHFGSKSHMWHMVAHRVSLEHQSRGQL